MTEKTYAKGMNLFSTRDCLQMDLELETVDDSIVLSRLSINNANSLANSRSRERRKEVCQSASRSIRRNEWEGSKSSSRIQSISVKNSVPSTTVIVDESDDSDNLSFKYSSRRNKTAPVTSNRSMSPEVIMKIDEDRESSETMNTCESAANSSLLQEKNEKEKERDEKTAASRRRMYFNTLLGFVSNNNNNSSPSKSNNSMPSSTTANSIKDCSTDANLSKSRGGFSLNPFRSNNNSSKSNNGVSVDDDLRNRNSPSDKIRTLNDSGNVTSGSSRNSPSRKLLPPTTPKASSPVSSPNKNNNNSNNNNSNNKNSSDASRLDSPTRIIYTINTQNNTNTTSNSNNISKNSPKGINNLTASRSGFSLTPSFSFLRRSNNSDKSFGNIKDNTEEQEEEMEQVESTYATFSGKSLHSSSSSVNNSPNNNKNRNKIIEPSSSSTRTYEYSLSPFRQTSSGSNQSAASITTNETIDSFRSSMATSGSTNISTPGDSSSNMKSFTTGSGSGNISPSSRISSSIPSSASSRQNVSPMKVIGERSAVSAKATLFTKPSQIRNGFGLALTPTNSDNKIIVAPNTARKEVVTARDGISSKSNNKKQSSMNDNDDDDDDTLIIKVQEVPRLIRYDTLRKSDHYRSTDDLRSSEMKALSLSRTNSSATPELTHDFPQEGVLLSIFDDFIEKVCGGKSAIVGLTTADVCEKFLKPYTKESNLSYCKLLEKNYNHQSKSSTTTTTTNTAINGMKCGIADLSSQPSSPITSSSSSSLPPVKPATRFISHAWQFLFLDVVDALHSHFEVESNNNFTNNRNTSINRESLVTSSSSLQEVYVWFDLFSNNQHDTSNIDFSWWSSNFKSAVGTIGHTVLILSPWDNPIPLQRAWCLFEIFCSVEAKSTFQVAMPRNEQTRFLDAMTQGYDVVNRMIAIIDAERSESWNPLDKELIFEVVRNTVGFNEINACVCEQLREWVISTTKVAIDNCQLQQSKNALNNNNNNDNNKNNDGKNIDTAMMKLMSLKSSLGQLYYGQGKYKEAEIEFKLVVDWMKLNLGEKEMQTLVNVDFLGNTYAAQSKYTLAETIYIDNLSYRIEILGRDHNDTLISLEHLASLYFSLGSYDQVLPLFLQCYEMRRNRYGIDAQSTLNVMNNLALLYFKLSRYDESEELYIECLEHLSVVLGMYHPDRLCCMNGLGTLYSTRKQYDKSELLFAECLAATTTKLGIEHPNTLDCMNNLGIVYKNQGKYSQALLLLLKCLEVRTHKLGKEHSDTTTTLDLIASVYEKQGDYIQCQFYLCQVHDIYKSHFGIRHATTLKSMTSLALMYEKTNSIKDAERLLIQCLEYRVSSNGSYHKDSITSMSNLARFYFNQKLYDLSSPLYAKVRDCTKALYGPENLDYIKSCHNLAITYHKQRRTTEATELFTFCYAKRKVLLGENHPETILTRKYMLANLSKR